MSEDQQKILTLEMQLAASEEDLKHSQERVLDVETELRKVKQQLKRGKEELEREVRESCLEAMRIEKAQDMKKLIAAKGDELKAAFSVDFSAVYILTRAVDRVTGAQRRPARRGQKGIACGDERGGWYS